MMLLLAVVGVNATVVVPSTLYSEPSAGSFYLYNVTQQRFLLLDLENESPDFSDIPEEVVLEVIDGDAYSRYKIHAGSGYYLKAGHANNNSHLMWLNPFENADQFKWGFKASSDHKYRMFTWFSISFNDNGYTWAQYNNYFSSCTSSTATEADADEWALISVSDYKAYYAENQIPVSYRSEIPTSEGQYYLYDIINRKFLDTRDGSFDDTPQALATITPSGEKFLITGYDASNYLKVGKSQRKYLWYNGNNTNKWVIAAKTGEEFMWDCFDNS